MNRLIQRLQLYYHTVRYLKPVQLYGRFLRSRPIRHAGSVPSRRPLEGKWTREPFPARKSRLGPRRFRFLNQEHDVSAWDDTGLPLLWVFNLNYFETPEADLMDDFVRRSPVGRGRGWHPYPVSLRIANWIKWSLRGEDQLSGPAVASLANQAHYLSQRIEYHLLANHLLANAKALVFAGCFFQGDESERWLQKGLDIFCGQLPEQIRPDGAHFEQSPMYHSIITQDILDLLNLASCFPRKLQHVAKDWGELVGRMCGWLEIVSHPDGDIALFNDSALGVARTPVEIAAYAAALGIVSRRQTNFVDGYIRLENAKSVVMFDAAPIGPDYQPGHGHADALSFELSNRGRRLVVNSGTSTYEANVEREYERSTRAHNCVVVDAKNQSEVWSVFRVARRARTSRVRTDHRTFAEATHDGYTRLREPVLHRRRLDLHDGDLVVTDELRGSGSHEIDIFLHLHPDADVGIEPDPRLESRYLETTYRPAFNTQVPNLTYHGRWRGACPVTFTTRILLP